METLNVLETRLQQWRVPSDVSEAIRRAVATVAGEGATLVEAIVGEELCLAVRGQPGALYLSPSRLAVALDAVDAERAHGSDSALGLDKIGLDRVGPDRVGPDSERDTWIVHCRYGRLDSSRLGSMTALMIKALRRYAPRPEPRQPVTRPRRRTTSAAETGGARSGGRSTTPSRPRTGGRQSQEDRRRAADEAIPRCPVPGCNLPMIGGSCGFHD